VRFRVLEPFHLGRADFARGDTLDTDLTPVSDERLIDLLKAGKIKEDLNRGPSIKDRMHRGIIKKG
jgi:hypothetical protein